VVKRALLVLLWLAVWASASGSQTFAFRASKMLQAGKFAQSYALFERALLESRKESDLLSEGRVLIAMAKIRTQSLEFTVAGEFLAQVRESALDLNGKMALLDAKLSLLNEQEKYQDAVALWRSVPNATVSKASDLLQGNLQCEAALAYAGAGDTANANKRFDEAEDLLDGDAPGRLAFARGRASALNGEKEKADSLYAVAEKSSIAAGNSYMTATILYYRGSLSPEKSASQDRFLRSANAFELLGLPNNQHRSEKLLNIKR
jgi:hypothetical protein